jgi:phosphatidylcholine synthase
LSLVAIWAVLVGIALADDFNPGAPGTVGLCAIAVYIVASDAVIQFARSFNT